MYTCYSINGGVSWSCHWSYSEEISYSCGGVSNYCDICYIYSPYSGGAETGTGGGGSEGSDDGGSDPKYPRPEVCDMGYEPDGKGGCILNVSSYLSPVKSGDDVNNPYDGMQAVGSDGMIYTYNAELNAWLMPDLQVLFENGYDFNASGVIDFDGAVLSTVVGLALVEPTPIGEIVVGGVVLVVYLYKIHHVSTDRVSEEDWELCNIFYRNCYVPNCVNCCHNCLTICRKSQGAWPFDKCPI